MSVGGGFKKGKAEFAVKDVNGKDITIATDSFRYEAGTDKILRVDGVEIDSSHGDYGLYFVDAEENEFIISPNAGKLRFAGYCYFDSEVNFNNIVLGGFIYDSIGNCLAGDITNYGKPAYLSCNDGGKILWSELNDIHCWTIKAGIYTLKLYIADYTGNSKTNNLYTYFANETSDDLLRLKYDKVVNITGFVMVNAKTYNPISYRIYRSGNAGNYVINIALDVIGKDSNNAVDIQSFNVTIDSASYQDNLIKYEF